MTDRYPDPQPNVDVITEYLAIIHRGHEALIECGLRVPNPAPGWSGRRWRMMRVEQAANWLVAANRCSDVTISNNGFGWWPEKGHRGSAELVSTLNALFVDVDVAGPGHAEVAGRRYVEDTLTALELLDAAPIPEPTLTIESGHGLHCLWQPREPASIATSEDLSAAKSLSYRFTEALVVFAAGHGYAVDRASDLARHHRVPGTINRKDPERPVPVTLISDTGSRYSVSELASYAVLPAPPPSRLTPPRRERRRLDDGPSPADLLESVPWAAILEPAGFVPLRQHGEAALWAHPAQTSPRGTPAATTDANGIPVLVVHSESTSAATGLPAGPGHRLTKFRVYALLQHGGEESAAARAIREMIGGAA